MTETRGAYEMLLSQLEDIAITSDNQLQLSERSYRAADASLQQLKEYILSNPFRNKEEEIRFFKEEKPLFLKELIYYRELFRIEAGKPVSDSERISEYYKKIIDGIGTFFERNQMIYTYYRTGRTIYDEQFFLRDMQHPLLLPESMTDMDTRFCTVNSFKFGKIKAYEKLNDYLVAVLEGREEQQPRSPSQNILPDVTWTDSKVALIELAYAIHSRGAINNGKADVKDVVTRLEQAFNISLGNYYAVFQQNIRIRKKNRTVFMDQLREYLERRMDELDEHPRY